MIESSLKKINTFFESSQYAVIQKKILIEKKIHLSLVKKYSYLGTFAYYASFLFVFSYSHLAFLNLNLLAAIAASSMFIFYYTLKNSLLKLTHLPFHKEDKLSFCQINKMTEQLTKMSLKKEYHFFLVDAAQKLITYLEERPEDKNIGIKDNIETEYLLREQAQDIVESCQTFLDITYDYEENDTIDKDRELQIYEAFDYLAEMVLDSADMIQQLIDKDNIYQVSKSEQHQHFFQKMEEWKKKTPENDTELEVEYESELKAQPRLYKKHL